MEPRNRCCSMLRRGLQPICSSSLDLISERGPLAVGNCWMVRGRRAALLAPLLDRYTGKSCQPQFVLDQPLVVVAVWRPRQEPRRIVRKYFGERAGDLMREYVFVDTIPDIEDEGSAGFEDPFGFQIPLCTIGEKHDPELTADDIKLCIGKWQGERVCLLPSDASILSLSLCRMIEHRPIEVCHHIPSVWSKLSSQCARHDTGAGGRLEHARRRKGGNLCARSSAKPAKISGTR